MENYKKRYEDLYERISNLVRDYDCVSGLIDVREELKSILNESQESEDESVRKHLIKHFMAKTKEEWNGMPIKNIIAWLEKKGEQKVDKCEGCNNVKGCITCTDGDQYAHITEQKPAWSEEDEKYTHGLIRGLTAKRDIYKQITFSSDNLDITETINWLNSLKNRIWFQQKYDNDEDLNNIADRFMPEPVWNALEESEGEGSNAAAYDYSQMIAMFKAGVHWLKSLKERYTWKPSDEQMKALLKLEEMHVLEHEKNQENAHLYMVVKSIREQLLKLKGE